MSSQATWTSPQSFFTHAQAREWGLSQRAITDLRDSGQIHLLRRGIYASADAPLADLELIEIAIRTGRPTMCLTSALAHHGLIDDIPARIDLALPRTMRPPTSSPAIRWHRFDDARFDLGRTTMSIADRFTLGLYSPQRCIVDAFRMRAQESAELGITALKRWLAIPGSQPNDLLSLAREFPRAYGPMREALAILL